MDELIAYRQVEMDPLDRIAGILKLGFAAIACYVGGKAKPDDFDPQRSAKPKGKRPSPSQAAAIARATLPGAGGP